MLVNILILIAGLVLILGGANFLTDGSSAVARRMGISDLVIGLTVVAFGTSTPELAISVVSAVNGSTEIAIGNIVGSNILNIFLIIGLTALIRPLPVNRSILSNDIPLVVLSSLVLLAMGNGPLLDGTPQAVLSRIDGIVLLLFFLIFMRYTISQAHVSRPSAEGSEAPAKTNIFKDIVYILGGLAALIYGGNIFVDADRKSVV